MADRQSITNGGYLRWAVLRAIGFAIAALIVVYAIDFAVLRFRIAGNYNPYGTVQVHPYYAVPRKDHKTEFLFDDPHDQTCVNSLLPQAGDSPCWYLSRHRDQRIDM